MTRRMVLGLYLLVLALPIYWLVNMSFKDTSRSPRPCRSGRISRPSSTTFTSLPTRPGMAGS